MVMVTLLVLLISGFNIMLQSDWISMYIVADLSDSTASSREEIQQYVKDIAKAADIKTKTGVIAFARDSVYVSRLGAMGGSLEKQELEDASVTDINAALLLAAQDFPEDTTNRIVIISDGKVTDGASEQTAAQLAKKGVRIDTVYIDTTELDYPEVQISRVNAPSGVFQGKSADYEIIVESNMDTHGTLTIHGDNISQTIDIEIKAGENVYTASQRTLQKGAVNCSFEVSAALDTKKENNTFISSVAVKDKPSLLILAENTSEAGTLRVMLANEYNVTVRSTRGAPKTLANLCNYDQVLLLNAACTNMPEGFTANLEQYVEKKGGSLITAGGGSTYIYGEMEGTELENMLPIDLHAEEEEMDKSLAMVIVIDNSSSMNGSPLQMAKLGAIKSVNSMKKNSHVGVITFSSVVEIVSPLTPAERKGEVTKAISAIPQSHGTKLYNALVSAQQMLNEFEAEMKHVIILSDGQPSDSGFEDVVKQMYEQGITTSAIALGSGSYASLMENLAKLGGGRYSKALTPIDLPEIMEAETIRSQVDYYNNVTFVPQVYTYIPVLGGMDEIPELHGYISSSMKEEATCVLYTDEDRPIYSVWNYGKGSVASFMSDLSGNWSSDWLNSQSGKLFIFNMFDSILKYNAGNAALYAEVNVGAYSTRVDVTIPENVENQHIMANLTAADGTKQEILMTETEKGYTCTFDTEEEGVYQLDVIQLNGKNDVCDKLSIPVAVTYSPEYDVYASGGEQMLAKLAETGRGVQTNNAEELSEIEVTPIEVEKNPLILFALIISVAVIADIAVRKLRKKDITDFWKKLSKNMKREVK